MAAVRSSSAVFPRGDANQMTSRRPSAVACGFTGRSGYPGLVRVSSSRNYHVGGGSSGLLDAGNVPLTRTGARQKTPSYS